MIAQVKPLHDSAIADFWMDAWQITFSDIDFEARRVWILEHLADMRANQHIVRAFFDADRLLGFYSLFQGSGLVEQICVSPEAKGRGIGALLMADATNQTSHALNLIVNEDNLNARRFYAKLGFVETGHRIDPKSLRGVIALQMSAERAKS